MELSDSQYVPFNLRSGPGRADDLFGVELPCLLEEPNVELVALSRVICLRYETQFGW